MVLRGGLLAAALLWTSPALAAGPAGPAVTVKQVAAPEQLIAGVKTLQVADFKGTKGPEIALQVKAELANQERMKTDAGEVGKQALEMGTDVAAQYVGGLVGGGLQGKLVEGLTKGTVSAVRNKIEQEPLVLDSGLMVNPFTVVEDGADAVLGGVVTIDDKVEPYTTKQQQTDSDGNVITDGDGNPVMIEVNCKRRMVEVNIAWTVRGTAQVKGEVKRQGGDARCGADMGNLLSAQVIAEAVLGDVGPAIVRDLAPAWRVRRLGLNKSKVVKDALKFIHQEDWDGARCAFRAAADANPDDSDALFDHGVLLEAHGHFDAASARYAQAIAVKDKKVYQKAADRVVKRKAEVDAMTAAYGLTWKISPEPAACGA